MVDKLFLDHARIDSLQAKVARDITISGWKPELVVGLVRGGLAPAVNLSHYFNIPMLSLHVSFRDWAQQQSMQPLVEQVLDQKNILIVDDINDTGKSLQSIHQNLELLAGNHVFTSGQVRVAVLVNNLGSDYEVDYYGVEIDKRERDQWVVFPWENWWEM